MFQIPVEEAEVEPGTAYEWRLVAQNSGAAVSGRAAGYNQAQHFTVALGARAAGTRAAVSMSGTFEIHGQVDLNLLEAALSHFVRRHEVLRARYEPSGEDLACTVVEPDEVTLEISAPTRLLTSADVREHLKRAFQGVDTLSGPLVALGAVLRDDSATVYLAFDHLVADAKSVVIAIDDIATAYDDLAQGRQPHPQPAGSYLEFSHHQRQRHQGLAAADPRLDLWREFRARGGGFLPRFPLDLGVEPGRSYAAANETHALLTAPEADALEDRCREAGGKLFMAALVAMAVAQRDEGGPDVHRTLMLVNDRGDGRYANSVGWFINAQPIEIPAPAGTTFATLMASARKVCDEARQYSDVHYLPSWGLLTPEEDTKASRWPHPINLFSYMDLRKAPGGEHLIARRARKYNFSAKSSSVLYWLFRDHDGMHLNTIYADTPVAKRTQAGLTSALARALRGFAAA